MHQKIKCVRSKNAEHLFHTICKFYLFVGNVANCMKQPPSHDSNLELYDNPRSIGIYNGQFKVNNPHCNLDGLMTPKRK